MVRSILLLCIIGGLKIGIDAAENHTAVDFGSMLSFPSDAECNKNHSLFCELRNCKHVTVSSLNPRQFIELPNFDKIHRVIEFYVIVPDKCDKCMLHVILSTSVNGSEAAYKFLIDNNQIVIYNGRTHLRAIKTSNVLSNTQPIHFRIEISSNGVISIFRNEAAVATALDRNSLPVQYFSFTTDQQTHMDFFYNCGRSSTTSETLNTASIFRNTQSNGSTSSGYQNQLGIFDFHAMHVLSFYLLCQLFV